MTRHQTNAMFTLTRQERAGRLFLVICAWAYTLFLIAMSSKALDAVAEQNRLSPFWITVNVIGFVAFLVCWPGSIWLWIKDRKVMPSSWLWLAVLIPLGLLISPVFIIRSDTRWRRSKARTDAINHETGGH